jgi:predicted metal-dependent hydrolase
MTIRDEGATLAAELARMVDVENRAVEHAIEAQDQKYAPNRRNRVSTLSTVAWLTALLGSMPATERGIWLRDSAATQPTRLERLLAGDLAWTAAELADHVAGPFDVSWDGNWPSAAPRLRGLMPPTERRVNNRRTAWALVLAQATVDSGAFTGADRSLFSDDCAGGAPGSLPARRGRSPCRQWKDRLK